MKIKLTFYFVVLITLLSINKLVAQTDTIDFNDNVGNAQKKISDKIFFGGSFGLQFGTITAINLSPTIGYRIVPKVESGIGVSYNFYRNSYYDYQFSYYGGNVFARYFPLKNFYITGMLEMLNVEPLSAILGLGGNRIWVPGVLAGGGYRQMLGQRFGTQITFLYNFTMTESTPYINPIMQIDFIF